LSYWGLTVYQAESSTAVVDELCDALNRGTPFALAIIDTDLAGMNSADCARGIKLAAADIGVQIVLLTSLDQDTDNDTDCGVGYLVKPVRQSALRACIAAIGGAKELRQLHSEMPKSSSEEAIGAHVLLVEDNPVNLEVGIGILESFGCRVDTASNGTEALDRHGYVDYNLIFMDCQMPGMDGFEATAEIRKREANSGRRTPIVALTASAIEGDREQCLAAGMDDYVPKPFTAAQMRAALSAWLKPAASNGHPRHDHLTVVAHSSKDAPIDEALPNNLAQLQREGQPDVVKTLFLESAPTLLKELREAAAIGDSIRIGRACHAQSCSANVGAAAFAARCEELEGLARTGSGAETRTLVNEIVEDYQREPKKL